MVRVKKETWGGFAVKTLMMVLISVMTAAFAYVISIGGLTSCFNLRARKEIICHRRILCSFCMWISGKKLCAAAALRGWAVGLLADFNVYVVLIAAWILYKESSWIKTVIVIALMLTIGSVATCGYIIMQFYKLSPEESSKDPLYYVLARHKKRDDTRQMKGASVVTLTVIFSVLGCLVLEALVYTVIVDFTPFRGEFAPCLPTYLVDIYVHVVILSVWIVYKESSLINAFFWILSHLCFGTVTMCVYVVRELSRLSPQHLVSHIIFSANSRDMQSSEPLLDANSTT